MQDWGEWIQISSNPQNTPYGAYLEGEAKLNIALRNEAGKELTIVNWGEGFMSKKICEGADGKPAAEGVNCKITTPGAVIAAQINNQLNTGTESLIEADEINEIIGALINQLTLQAMQGVNGLLGLGGNSKYTDYSYGDGDNTTSFIESAVTQQSLLNTNLLKQQIASSTDTQTAYLVLAQNTITIASIKTGVITDGQIALTNLLTSSTTASLGITINSTYAEAQAKVNAAVSNGTLPLAVLANIQAQMTAVYNSLAIVAAISPNLVQGTDLTTIPFTTLQSGSNIAKTSLTTFIAGITAELPQIQTTLTSLQQMNAVFVNATSTTALSSNAAQRVVTEYITLIQSGVVISAAGLETKRREWTDTIN
jgi:hypothetical protein